LIKKQKEQTIKTDINACTEKVNNVEKKPIIKIASILLLTRYLQKTRRNIKTEYVPGSL